MTRVLFATAEFAPLARVGGLAEATAGLVARLRADRVDVEVVLPDYGDVVLERETTETIEPTGSVQADHTGQSHDAAGTLGVPAWAGPVTVRRGVHPDAGAVTLLGTESMRRPNPYVNADGAPWPDNDERFFAFSAGIAALARRGEHTVLHLNDWHTAATVGFVDPLPPTVLTIHTLGYQGITGAEWADRLSCHQDAFAWYDGVNPLAAAIRTVDRIVAVSPTYAREMLAPDTGAGLHDELRARGAALVGIRNGIDTDTWDPSSDPTLARRYGRSTVARAKPVNQRALLEAVGLPDSADADAVTEPGPVIGVVSRLVDQKGIDLLADCLGFAPTLPARFVILGAGQAGLAQRLRDAANADPNRVAFVDGYDADLAHAIFAGADLFVMPSRFEPCGLAQMQAMAYGTLPIVTDVGGLHDTVTDADADPDRGTGIVLASASTHALADGLHRGVRLWRNRSRRRHALANGMATDWSWAAPAADHLRVYADAVADAAARLPAPR